MNLHLGCGNNIIQGWINVDIEPMNEQVTRADLSKPLPFESQSADLIFNEHFLEHLTREEGLNFLKECYRVLKPGGVIRIITPDLQILVEDFINGNIHRWKEIWQPKTRCQMVNEGMRSWGHQFLYDAMELLLTLNDAGFNKVQLAKHKKGYYTKLLDNLDFRPYHQELIFEAMK